MAEQPQQPQWATKLKEGEDAIERLYAAARDARLRHVRACDAYEAATIRTEAELGPVYGGGPVQEQAVYEATVDLRRECEAAKAELIEIECRLAAETEKRLLRNVVLGERRAQFEEEMIKRHSV